MGQSESNSVPLQLAGLAYSPLPSIELTVCKESITLRNPSGSEEPEVFCFPAVPFSVYVFYFMSLIIGF